MLSFCLIFIVAEQGWDTLVHLLFALTQQMSGDHSHSWAAEEGHQWYLLTAVNRDTTSPLFYSSLQEEAIVNTEAATTAVSGNVCSGLPQLLSSALVWPTHLLSSHSHPHFHLWAFPSSLSLLYPERTNSCPLAPDFLAPVNLDIPSYFLWLAPPFPQAHTAICN